MNSTVPRGPCTKLYTCNLVSVDTARWSPQVDQCSPVGCEGEREEEKIGVGIHSKNWGGVSVSDDAGSRGVEDPKGGDGGGGGDWE